MFAAFTTEQVPKQKEAQIVEDSDMKEEAKDEKLVLEEQSKAKEVEDDFQPIYSVPKENYEDLKPL